MKSVCIGIMTMTAVKAVHQPRPIKFSAPLDPSLENLELILREIELLAPENRPIVVMDNMTPSHIERDDPDYSTKFAKLYPTAAVDFFKTENRPVGHDRTMAPRENIVIPTP